MSSNTNTQNNMRIYHRYLGFFLAGIMAVYAISGITLIFRDTDFLKSIKQVEKQVKPNLSSEELGRELRIRDLKVEKEEGDIVSFKQGTYNKATGVANYKTKQLNRFVDKLQDLHKANTKSPLFYLNIFFGLSLFFFVVSAFYMFLPGTSTFKKGLYFTLAGLVLTIILLFV
ncbi:MAG: PepSY domain-containing protein [Dolichospermum sp.]|nr:PepSY domain-containing protein [Dolichospermum sp.]